MITPPALEAGQTVFVRGTGGVIFEMDVPKAAMARERFDEQLAKEELVLVESAVWVDRGDGSRYLVEGKPADEPAVKRPRGRKAATEVADDQPVDHGVVED